MSSSTFLVVVLLLLGSVLVHEISGECMHDELTAYYQKGKVTRGDTSLPVSVQDYNGALYPSANNTNSIRIKFDLSSLENDPYTCYTKGAVVNLNDNSDPYTCKTSDILSTAQKNLLTQSLLPQAAARLASALKVIQPQSVLQLSSAYTKCGYGPQVTVNSSYINPGVSGADLILFITSRPITQEGVIAFGSPCQQDQLGRPIAGQLNFNPAYVTPDSDLQEQLGTALHEITHVLGFTFDKFNYFNFNASNTTRSRVAYVDTQAPVGAKNALRNVTKINTPAVLSWVRNHFGCSALDGAELEDGGTSATKGSHWEKRLFANEYMTGSSSGNPIFSGLTLALFEDSGWYSVNYSAADPLAWGLGQGCDFVNKSCASWSTDLGYFCYAATTTPQCSPDLTAKAGCGIKTYSSSDSDAPPLFEQYFSDPLIGGVDDLADYCPFMEPYSNGWCTDTSNAASNDDTYSQIYSNSSRCFMSTVSVSLTPVTTPQAICFPTYCTSPTQLKVKVGNIWYDCADGAELEPHTSFKGSFTCPTTAILCTGAAEDNTWPTISSVSPTHGGPGDWITITGTNFNNHTTVTVYSPCDEVTFVDNTTVLAKLSTATLFQSLKAVAGKSVDVVVGDNRTGHNTFLSWGFKVNTGPTLLNQAITWLRKHIWAPAIFGGVVLLAIIICCCKRKGRKKRKVAPEDEETGRRKKKGNKKQKKKKRPAQEEYDDYEEEEEERAPRKKLPRAHSVPARKPTQQHARQMQEMRAAQSMKPQRTEHAPTHAHKPTQAAFAPQHGPMRAAQGAILQEYEDYDSQYYPPPAPQNYPSRAPPRQPPQQKIYQPYPPPNAQYDNSYYMPPPPHASHPSFPHPPPPARRSNLHQPAHAAPMPPNYANYPNHAEYVDVDYQNEYHPYTQNQGKYDYR